MLTLILLGAASGVTGALLGRICGNILARRSLNKRVSRRVDKISDEALKVVLGLFHERSGHVKGEHRIDARFVDDVTRALADHALTAVQIRRLFRYTYTVEADADLKRYFGWEDALREAVDSSEEKALEEFKKEEARRAEKLPLIDDASFAAFKSEFFASQCNEIQEVIRRWPFSFTLAQQAEILERMKDGPETDRSKWRNIVRREMRIHTREGA